LTDKKIIRFGLGFATGRSSFKKVLRTYVYNLKESGLRERENVCLSLIVAYDLKYTNTKKADYTDICRDILDYLDETYFIGNAAMTEETEFLIREQVVTREEAEIVFGKGYAGKRNAVLYCAIKNNIDYLIFLDDDEYPMAVTKTRDTAVWGGQHVLSTHLEHIKNADITHGHHCGYISPIPYMEFNDVLTEADFRSFIEAISNDIINWDKIRTVMQSGGVTYADTKILTVNTPAEVREKNHAKFISGANLCINLTDLGRIRPFYNPPGARGEDTFLSTCLSHHKVLRVPCYTFHDGFSTYHHLMDGVLPINLKYIRADSEPNIDRFYRACIGWVRYKPLLVYITNREQYAEKIDEMREKLSRTIPKICSYFQRDSFRNIMTELEKYHKNVDRHFRQFQNVLNRWADICSFLQDGRPQPVDNGQYQPPSLPLSQAAGSDD